MVKLILKMIKTDISDFLCLSDGFSFLSCQANPLGLRLTETTGLDT